MFADYVKMGVKIALVATITAAVIAIFANVQIPAIDTAQLSNAIGAGLAIYFHWTGNIGVTLWNIVLTLLAIELALLVFKVAKIAYRWILKINE